MRGKSIVLALVFALALAGSASADIIDFATGTGGLDGGTITYAGLGGPLVGANILIGRLRSSYTPSEWRGRSRD